MGMKENFRQAAKELMSDAAEHPAEAETRTGETPSAAPPAPSKVVIERVAPPAAPVRTVIAAGDVLKGDLTCTGGADLCGDMTGNITGSGDLRISGNLRGNAAGRDIAVWDSHVHGDLGATGGVSLNAAAAVTGNIRAASLRAAGRINGSIEVTGVLILDEGAAVLGDLSAQRISVSEGALLQGRVNIRRPGADKLFPDWPERKWEGGGKGGG